MKVEIIPLEPWYIKMLPSRNLPDVEIEGLQVKHLSCFNDVKRGNKSKWDEILQKMSQEKDVLELDLPVLEVMQKMGLKLKTINTGTDNKCKITEIDKCYLVTRKDQDGSHHLGENYKPSSLENDVMIIKLDPTKQLNINKFYATIQDGKNICTATTTFNSIILYLLEAA